MTQREVAVTLISNKLRKQLFSEIIAKKDILAVHDMMVITTFLACDVIEAYASAYDEDKKKLVKDFCEALTQAMKI